MKRRLNVMLSEKIVAAMDEYAAKEQVSRSRFIERAVYKALKQRKKAEMDAIAEEGYKLYAEENVREAEEGMAEWSAIVLADQFDGIEEYLSDDWTPAKR